MKDFIVRNKRPLPNSSRNGVKFVIKPSWRKTILEWMYGLTTKCSTLSQEAVAVAAVYWDTSTGHGMVDSETSFKVMAIACLFIAIKLIDYMSVTS